MFYDAEILNIIKKLQDRIAVIEMDFWRVRRENLAGKNRKAEIRRIFDCQSTVLEEIKKRMLIWVCIYILCGILFFIVNVLVLILGCFHRY